MNLVLGQAAIIMVDSNLQREQVLPSEKAFAYAARFLCVLALAMSLTTAAFAADPPEPAQPSPCYPTAVTRSEDGGEIRKMYDLGPKDDPAGIPRSDFEQEGYRFHPPGHKKISLDRP